MRPGDSFPVAPSYIRRAKGARRAVYMGEKRPPKRGEWYLSGAIVEAYYAPNDLSTPFHIAALVNDPPPDVAACLRAMLSMVDGLPWHVRDSVYREYNARVGALPGSLPEPIAKARAALGR